jgi:hypothetical protein
MKWYRLPDGRWINKDGIVLTTIRGGGMPVETQNDRYAFGDDDGSESAHSLDTENTPRTAQDLDTNFTIRIQIAETGGGSANITPTLYCSYESGTYTAVTTTSSASMPCRLVDDANSRADNEATTERLTAGAGSWQAGEYDDGQTDVGGDTISGLTSEYTEVEFMIELDSTYATDGETFDFRVYNGTAAFDSYPGTSPRATASAATPINLTVDALSQTNTVDKVAITKESTLVVDPLSQTNTVDKVPITKESDLTVYDLSQSNFIEAVTLSVTNDLVVHNLSQNNSVISNYIHKLESTYRHSQILYHPMVETAGGVANDYSPEENDGTFVGVDLANAAGPDFEGVLVPYFDGANDYNDIETAGLEADFNGSELTMLLWLKVNNAGIWTDGTIRRAWNMQMTGGVGDNNIRLERLNSDNTFRVIYQANSTNEIFDITMSDTDWFVIALRVSASEDTAKVFKDGSQEGATQTALGSWSGSFGNTVIGASTVIPSNVWNGWIAHGMIYAEAIPDAVIAYLSDPTIDLMWLEQAHSLQVDNLSQSNTVELVTLVQEHNLTVDDLSQANEVSVPTLTQVHNLTVHDLSQSNLVENVVLSTEGVLAVYNLSQSNLVGVPTLTQIHNITVHDLSQSNLVEKVTLNTSTTLVVDNLSQSNLIEAVNLTQVHVLVVDNLSQSNLVLYIDLTQIHVLSVYEINQSNTLDKITLSAAGDVVAFNLAQPNLVEKVSLTQLHTLSVDDLSQSNLVEFLDLDTESALIVYNLGQTNLVESLDLTQIHNLANIDLGQTNAIEVFALTQLHNISVYDLSQTSQAPQIPLSGEGTVTPFALFGNNQVQVVELIQEHNVNVSDVFENNFVETITLAPVPKLVLADLSNSNAVDYAGITTEYSMTVYDLSQSQQADLIVWGAVLGVKNLSQTNTLWNSSFWQEQFEFNVTIAQKLYIDVGIDQQQDVSEVDL